MEVGRPGGFPFPSLSHLGVVKPAAGCSQRVRWVVVLRPSVVMLSVHGLLFTANSPFCSATRPCYVLVGISRRWMTRVCAVVRSERRRDRPWYVKNGKNKEGGGVYDGGPVIGRDLGMVA